jgi:signal transduction histidine kinase
VPARRWSLSRRLTLWFVLGTTGLTCAMAAVTGYFVVESIHHELDVIAENRLKELRVRLASFDPPTAENFDAIARDIASNSHDPLAWRVWSVAWQWVEHDCGAVELLTDEFDKPGPKDRTLQLDGGKRWRTEVLQNDLQVGLLLDGSERFKRLREYQVWAGGVLAAGVVASTLVGLFLMRRSAVLLRRVADSARRVREPGSRVDVDVTHAPDEIREVVDALHELLGNVHAATERHRVLYASMAHELRAPIQNLMGATEVALLSRRDADSYRKVLVSNLEELRELGDAIDNLMTICAPRDPQHAPVLEDFNVVDQARLRLEREGLRAERAGVHLTIESAGDVRMRGDRESVLRALRNLVANAIEWSPKDGEVHVAIDGNEHEIVAVVDDSGPGVPPDQRQRIFDPFYRGPSAAGRRVGYGLGLAIVKDAATRHNGSIEIETSPLGGARFRLRLPRQRIAPRELAPA